MQPPAKRQCAAVLKHLRSEEFDAHNYIFMEPVNLELFPDYKQKCPKPMDLQTIGEKLDRGEYKTPADFAVDCKLTFQNAIDYNGKVKERKWIATEARKMLGVFKAAWKKSPASKPPKEPPAPKAAATPVLVLGTKPSSSSSSSGGAGGADDLDDDAETATMVIHKILARKMDEEPDNPSKRCVWFLVKWKDFVKDKGNDDFTEGQW